MCLWHVFAVRWWSTSYINISSNTQKGTAYLLTVLQHAFKRAISCESQLLATIHDMVSYWNKNIQLDVIVLDFSKAFNTVPRDRFLGKLNHYDINGHIHSWISICLRHRSQYVLVDGAKSDPAHVVSGQRWWPDKQFLTLYIILAHIYISTYIVHVLKRKIKEKELQMSFCKIM